VTSDARYIVATDGACKGNPGPAGWAWVAEDGHWAAGSIPLGTNNIGELLGLIKAIEDHPDVENLVVQADSKYAIDTYEKWMDGHKRRGWKTSTGAPTKNRELLERLMAARDDRRAAGSGRLLELNQPSESGRVGVDVGARSVCARLQRPQLGAQRVGLLCHPSRL
jgi:ribonuclease HI